MPPFVSLEDREWVWPMTAEQAEAMRPEFAAYLRELADRVESGEVDYRGGDKIVIEWRRGYDGGTWRS